jgi:hypothetical protein
MFKLPNFNLKCDIWESQAGNLQPGTLLASSVPCQVYITDKFNNIAVRFPKGTDVRPFGYRHATTYDLLNISPPSTIWIYVASAGPIHRGFPNEFYAVWNCNYSVAPAHQFPWP